MKPLLLTISGWGPYKEKTEIDFTRLEGRGLFLITGATGAGKTTIFDALTYALYGSLSGQMREKNSVRSDFASEEVETFTELVMTHGLLQYRIRRNPEYMRPKKRRAGKEAYTREKENAVLWLPDGSVIEGTREVNARIQEILVLDYFQFKQISMIAQGEFARLLTASPRDKLNIFREIFGTGIYERFTQNLKQKSRQYFDRITELKHKLEEDVRLLLEEEDLHESLARLRPLTETDNWDYTSILNGMDAALEQMTGEQDEVLKAYREAEDMTHSLTQRAAREQENNRKIRELEQIRRKLSQMEQQKEEMAAREQELKDAQKAAYVETAEAKWNAARSQYDKNRKRRETLLKEISCLEEEKAELEPVYVRREEIGRYLEFRSGEERLQEERNGLLRQQEKKDRAFREAVEAYEKAEAERDRLRQQFEHADRTYKRAAVGIAARLLAEGQPCPVCGSLDHPAPAPIQEDIPSEKELNLQKEKSREAEQTLMERYKETASLKAEKDDLAKQLQELDARLTQYGRQRQEIRQELDRHGFAWDEPDKDSLQKCVERYRLAEGSLVSRRQEGQSLEQELDALKKQEQEQHAVFLNMLKEHGFAGEEAYRTAGRTAREMEELKQQTGSYREELAGAVNLAEHLQAAAAGLKPADEKETAEELTKWHEHKETCRQKQERLKGTRDWIRKTRRSILEKQDKIQKASGEYGYVKDLENIATGGNSRRLVFEQYVLAGYFEEILKAANLRFREMTGGRYEMSRVGEVGDGRIKDSLEIQVTDYYTGKPRSVKTLSGGETFKASLSLALGLSDVIQAMSGGIRVEALFIDEGFGALDSESLDQACEALQGLVEYDRLTGIISHVPELRERIDNQLIVKKTNCGSTVEIMIS